jgi:putative hydrolase of HD superfamily
MKKKQTEKKISVTKEKENVNYNNILDFFYEVGMLKRIPRTWTRAHVKHPESVADHTARSTIIGFILAKLEGADPTETALICAFHELAECRIGDLDKVQSSYICGKSVVEKKAVIEQMSLLPKDIADEMGHYILNEGTDNSKEQIIAKDADYVECAIQAKEYIEQGYNHTQFWIDNCKKCVRTESAKKFLNILENSNSQDWYKKICKIQRLD